MDGKDSAETKKLIIEDREWIQYGSALVPQGRNCLEVGALAVVPLSPGEGRQKHGHRRGSGCGMNMAHASSPDCMSTFSGEIGSKI